MTNALNDIFSKIQSVNSAFATVSLPMSVNTQGSYLNQLFVGMFRPDGSALPRWNGNIKQYKLGLDASQNVQLQDAAGAGAIDLGTGFINACALSFWTNVTKDAYWAFNPSGNCLGAQSSNSPDGNVVEKGAQAYMLRSLAVNSGAITRTVKTCSDSNCTALANFDTNLSTTAVPPSAFGASITTTSTPSRDNLINWARGVNNAPGPNSNDPDLLALPVTSYPVRPMVHGDVVHSRPVAINYGTDALAGRQVVVYYGGNDGMLRAVNGNPSITANGVPAGGELWSFMPPEFYGNILRLYNNSPQISYPGLTPMTSMPTPQPKTYGMDGPVTAYRSADGQKTWLYASMRRGGRAIYAFDVSSPAAPTLKWKLGCPHLADDTGCSTGFSGIGQTWSAPKSFTSIGYSSGASPMLVFGGGYDKCEDADPANCTSSNKGNQIYVVDANTGSLLKSFSTARGVVGEVTVVNNAAGQAQIAYAADLGGNVYRIDGMASGAPGTWTLTQVASLGCDTVTTCSPNRKFMFAPDVVQDSGAYVILIGSGDREKPLRSYTSALSVANRFYMLVDKPTDATWLSNEGPSGNADCGQGLLCRASLLAITSTATPAPADLSSKKGWYLTLAAGEQVVTASVTAYGTTTFDTHIPSDPSRLQSCKADLGMANVYNVAYTNAAGSNNGRFQNVTGGGLAPSPWLGPVQFEDGSTRDVCVGCSASSFLNPKGSTPQAAFKQPKGRVYWFIQR
ncbi:pilus assembly protein [Variovorax ureilyticus]|uniref:pilus assembly protein n=1 Tax=Variovorax ureilyticus TaxID=1836198 RepID=UPI003D67DD69